MRRHIPGLHSRQQDPESNLDGLFLARVERASYRWHRQKPFWELRFAVLEPKSFERRAPSLDGCTAPSERCGNSIGFFATSAMTPSCSTGTKWMRKPS